MRSAAPSPADESLVGRASRPESRRDPLTPSLLNERERARQEARAKKDRENADTLAAIGITPSEASLFHVVQYGLTVPPEDLCRRAAIRDYAIGSPVTVEENSAALADCLDKGWLQIVDEALLGRLQTELQRDGFLGPIYGYPSPGGVDFTRAGAEQWFQIRDRLWNGGHDASFAYCDVVHEKSAYFHSSLSKAATERDGWKDCENVFSVTGPSPIGPWRAQWWRRFPEGYRFDVELRAQWQGRGSGGGGHVFMHVTGLPFDLARACDLLNRHNVAWEEWLAMTSVEVRNDPRGIVWQAGENSQRFGKNLTKAGCLQGLEACLRNDWLRRVDEQYTAEINSLLLADSALMPVPTPVRHSDEIDFTANGAQLYRMLSAEIFGRDWEDHLCVENAYFREEHRYCETESGLVTVLQEYADAGEKPKSVCTVAIGPWCVYWWQRFRSGYRLELTFGDQ